MDQVAVYLDESLVVVCISHKDCSFAGKASGGKECDRRYVYGVGAAVFETAADAVDLANRLGEVRRRIEARATLLGKPGALFAAHGWHATDDLPEYAEPLLEELALGIAFKGHIRFFVSETPLSSGRMAESYKRLFKSVLAPLMKRYESASAIEVIFEADGTPLSAYEQLAKDAAEAAGVATNNLEVASEGKGSDLLAMADQVVYATLQVVGRNLQLCPQDDCDLPHRPPSGNEIVIGADGSLAAFSHMTIRDRWYRRYAVFSGCVSSLVEIPHHQAEIA